jgi:hypothetical protein
MTVTGLSPSSVLDADGLALHEDGASLVCGGGAGGRLGGGTTR